MKLKPLALFPILSVLSFSSIADINNGLIAHYKFQGNAWDSSGNGNNGSVSGAVLTTDRYNNPDSAYEFDGADVITVPHSNSLDLSENVSVSFWFKGTSNSLPQKFLRKGGYGSPEVSWFADVARPGGIGPGIDFYVSESGDSGDRVYRRQVGQTYFDGSWHHYLGVFDAGDSIKLYIDGNLVGAVQGNIATVTSMYQNTHDLLIGEDFHGVLDDIRIYNRPLNNGDIEDLTREVGLVAHYKFDGNAIDSTGNGNDGVEQGDVKYAQGVTGQALKLNGVDSYIQTNYTPYQNLDNDFTISTWIKWDGLNDSVLGFGRQQSVLAKWHEAGIGENEYTFLLNRNENGDGGKFTFGRASNSSIIADYVPPVGQWVMLTTTYKNGVVLMYANGQELGSWPVSTGYSGDNQPIIIGAGGGGHALPFYVFNGLIDDLRIYNRALSQSEIQALAGQSVDIESNLVAYYEFEGNAEDSSGNNNDGDPEGDMTFNADGIKGSAAIFDGIDDYIVVEDSPSLQVDNLSLSLWFKSEKEILTTSGPERYQTLVGKWSESELGNTSPQFNEYAVYIAKDNFRTIFPGEPWFLTPFQYDSSWHHLAVILGNGFKRTYLDGILIGEEVLSAPFQDTDSPIIIGGGASNAPIPIYMFEGKIDEVKIYSRALDENEIKVLADNADSETLAQCQQTSYCVDTDNLPYDEVYMSVHTYNAAGAEANFNPNYPTIIYTHGWQPSGTYFYTKNPPVINQPGNPIDPQEPSLLQTMRDRLESEGFGQFSGVNILLLNWADAYNANHPPIPQIDINWLIGCIGATGTTGYLGCMPTFLLGAQASEASIYDASRKLIEQLDFIGLNHTYTQPLHFIGHSHGAMINAYIVDWLTTNGKYIDQVTMLDSPISLSKTFGLGRLSPAKMVDLLDGQMVGLLENYYAGPISGFGGPIGGAFPGDGIVLLPPDTFWHNTVKDEYYFNIIEDRSSSFLYDKYTSTLENTEWITPALGINPGSLHHAVLAASSWNNSGKDYVAIDDVDEIIKDGFSTIVGAVTEYIEDNSDQIISTVNDAFQISLSITTGTPWSLYKFFEASPSSANYQLQVPEDALLLTFDFMKSGVSDGDWVSIYINGTDQWSILLDNQISGSLISESINLDAYIGQSVTIQISLNNAGEENAEFYIGNFSVLTANSNIDGDSISDYQEYSSCSDINDADTDDDGIEDGLEDINGNGVIDPGESDPCDFDTDKDGLSDGQESGVTVGITDPDGAGPLLGTDTNIFVPDNNPLTTSSPILQDTDGDGLLDPVEEANGSDPSDDMSWPNFADGDLAPLGAPDGVVNVADVLIMQQIISNDVAANGLQYSHGDLYPPGNPDGVIDISDLILLQKMVLQ